jgi:hypothetical protein
LAVTGTVSWTEVSAVEKLTSDWPGLKASAFDVLSVSCDDARLFSC